jgi:hypothetical protein
LPSSLKQLTRPAPVAAQDVEPVKIIPIAIHTIFFMELSPDGMDQVAAIRARDCAADRNVVSLRQSESGHSSWSISGRLAYRRILDRGDPLGILLLERLDAELELLSRTLDLRGGSLILGAPEPS